MTILLEAAQLSKTFDNGVKAVDHVDLRVYEGETLGVVGESGCGKSTTARLLLRLIEPDYGDIYFESNNLRSARSSELRKIRARLQFVPQHPTTSLNPRLRVAHSIEFNLAAQGWSRSSRAGRVEELLNRVGLAPMLGHRFPHELSGGQLQRAAIARALATNPALVICDEAVSALDKSIQAQILSLLLELQRDSNVAYFFISHDLAVIRHMSDRVAVMYLGRVVEQGAASEVFANPLHPYTEALLSAEPGTERERIVLSGDPPSPANPPTGCTFRTRCRLAMPECAESRPPLTLVAADHWVACVLHPKPQGVAHDPGDAVSVNLRSAAAGSHTPQPTA